MSAFDAEVSRMLSMGCTITVYDKKAQYASLKLGCITWIRIGNEENFMKLLAERDFRRNRPARSITNETYLNEYGNCYAIAESQAHYSRG
jgi:hypothetical protein